MKKNFFNGIIKLIAIIVVSLGLLSLTTYNIAAIHILKKEIATRDNVSLEKKERYSSMTELS